MVLPAAIAAAIGIYAGGSLLSSLGHADRPALGPAAVRWSAVVGGLLVGLAVAADLLSPRRTTEAWRIGAEGEERTAALLAGLHRRGWVVLHDRRARGRRGNIDHVVVGPGGVFVIDTKSWKGVIEIGRRGARHNGRDMAAAVDGVRRQVADVQSVSAGAAVGVYGVLAIHRARVRRRAFAGRDVGGVLVVPAGDLPRLLRRRPCVLSPSEVEYAAAVLDSALARATSGADVPPPHPK